MKTSEVFITHVIPTIGVFMRTLKNNNTKKTNKQSNKQKENKQSNKETKQRQQKPADHY